MNLEILSIEGTILQQKVRLIGHWEFYKKAIAIALPVMLQQFITALVSLIDNFMVSGLGDSMMAAVNVANQINFLFIVLLSIISTAGGIYLAQYKGANNDWGMQQAYRFKIVLSFIVGVGYMLSLFLSPSTLINIMTHGNSAQYEIVSHGANYMRTISFAALFMPFSFAIGSSFREIGKPVVPLIISVCATLVNTFLNWVLIYGNLGAPRMEVQGAAIATVIARALEAAAFIIYAKLKKEHFYVGLRKIRQVNIPMFFEIMRKSILVFFAEITWALSEMFVTSLYNSRGGSENVAGMASAFAIANIFFLLFAGIHTATAVLVGNRLGAGHLDEAQIRAKWIMSGSFIAGIVIGIFEGLSSLAIPFIYPNLTPEAHNISQTLLIIVSCYMPLWALLNSQFAVSRSGGDALFGVVVDIPVSALLFAPLAAYLTYHTGVSAPLIFGIAKFTDFAKLALALLLLSKKRWVRKLTKSDEVSH